MQRLAAKAGIGTVVLAIAAVAFLAGSAIPDGNAQEIQGAQLRTRGIEWPNFSTGIDYNARHRDATGGHKAYFAEIHLLIDLGSKSFKKKVDDAADSNHISDLRELLVQRIDTLWPGYHADTAIINALLLRPDTP